MLPLRLFGRSPRPNGQSGAGLTGEMMKIDMAEVAGRRFAERDEAQTLRDASASAASEPPASLHDDDDETAHAPIGKHAAPPESSSREVAVEQETDAVEETTSSWLALEADDETTCVHCGAPVGFSRRCPACGTPVYQPAIEDSDDDEAWASALSEVADPSPERDGGAGVPSSAAEPQPATDEDVVPPPAAVDTSSPRSDEPPAPLAPAPDPEEARIAAAAREIRAQAAEEQVAAVQSRLQRDKRLMAELDQLMREEAAARGDAQPSATAGVHQIRPGVAQPTQADVPPQPQPVPPDAAIPSQNDPHAFANVPSEGDPSMPDQTPFGANPGQQRAMRIMSGEAARAGQFADIANAMTINGRTIIDFFMIDRPEVEPGVDEAVHQARIIMQPDAVVALRDMLTEHIDRFYQREA